MKIEHIVFSKDPLDDDTVIVSLYTRDKRSQIGLLNVTGFTKENTCSIYELYKEYIEEITNHSLLYIDFLSESRGVIFTYEENQTIEYRNTYFSLDDLLFRYLFDKYVYKEKYQEKLKSLIKTKKSDTL